MWLRLREGRGVQPAVTNCQGRIMRHTVFHCVTSAATTPSGGWLGSGAEEGRAKLRYAPGRRKEPLIRRLPNGTSYHGKPVVILHRIGNAGN